MALVKCPECGREKVSDSAVSCPDCGYRIKEHFVKKREEEQKRLEAEEKSQKRIEAENLKQERNKHFEEEVNKKKELLKKVVKKLFPIIIISIVIIVGVCLYLTKIGKKEYREAINLFETENYVEAKKQFTSLDGYRDSEEYIEKCEVNIAVNKYSEGSYIVAYKELIVITPEVFERVMNSSTISLDDMLYNCRKNCADLGHIAYTEKNYTRAAEYYKICYEYDSVSYKDEYVICTNLPIMKTFWYYFKAGREIHEGFFYIENDDVWALGLEALGVKDGYYDYELKDGAVYIPNLSIYIYPPASEDAGKLTVTIGSSSYNFYDNQNYMANESKENTPKVQQSE